MAQGDDIWPPPNIKLILIGDPEVGKSMIVSRFADHYFNSDYINTIGIEFKNFAISVNNQHVILRIWDAAGQERFQFVTRAYYKGCAGVMVVYDVTKSTSFDNIKNWIERFKEHKPDGAEIMILGNKCDVENDSRMVSTDRGKLLAEECEAMFMEVSAKTGENIENAFTTLTQSILTEGRKQQQLQK